MAPGAAAAVARAAAAHNKPATHVNSSGESDAMPVKSAPPPRPPGVGFWKYQDKAESIYNHIFLQVSVAGLIGLNFLCNIVQAQVDPMQNKHNDIFGVFEWFFNIAFLLELILNMYGSWLCRFWKSGWNCFDFSVVLIGWCFQLKLPLPGPMKLLRMMRAFRVFRLFKRIESLRKILNSLAKAVPGVMNAFLIQLIIICIFAIIAVDRFRDWGEGGSWKNEKGATVEFQTSRGQDYGFEYFGDFGKSLFTMFQVLTGESWAEAIARPLFNSNSATTSMGSCFFFVLFCILNGVILINVVVAVLLEKMVDEPTPTEDGEEELVVDHLRVGAEAAKEEVVKLRGQMDYIIQVTAGLQKQMGDVVIVKAQVAALLAHAGVAAPAATPAMLLAAEPPKDPRNVHTKTGAFLLPPGTSDETDSTYWSPLDTIQ